MIEWLFILTVILAAFIPAAGIGWAIEKILVRRKKDRSDEHAEHVGIG